MTDTMKNPVIDPQAHIAKESVIVGDVTMKKDSSLFYYGVIRGDNGPVTIGERTNIQEHCLIHVDLEGKVAIGDDNTIGHGAILHGCTIGNNVTIGMGSIIMNGAIVGDNCIIGAGSMITQGKVIPPNSLAFGSPAKVVREVTAAEIEANRESALHYAECSAKLFG